ncbi:hypothetical protein WA026_023441 [Henosepilachna vigintioctopunctata]|uniref:HTH CENPB-type domain-containing protein n=1 Tax=Henosepilachna vigintioctopunctata TaxID=420089 RepID=A0AAW1UQN1_9CUCU
MLKNREDVKAKYRLGGVQRKEVMVENSDKLERVLLGWVHQARASKVPISWPIICEKARKIAEILLILTVPMVTALYTVKSVGNQDGDT